MVDWSTNSGAGRWIGKNVSDSIGPRSSTGSPITFMMRPSVAGPTGTRITSPVFVAGCPRTRPSVVSMATQRTVFSPRCCATSSTRLSSRSSMLALLTRSAVKISGSVPGGNSTSTTGPMTWRTFPFSFAIA